MQVNGKRRTSRELPCYLNIHRIASNVIETLNGPLVEREHTVVVTNVVLTVAFKCIMSTKQTYNCIERIVLQSYHQKGAKMDID